MNSLSKTALFAVIALLTIVSNSNAQLVFNASDLDGSFGQASQTVGNNIIYGMQPFNVSEIVLTANSLVYAGAFSADPAIDPSDPNAVSQLNVRTWDNGFIFISTAEDALNGVRTAQVQFNPLDSIAPNGQAFQDLIIQQQGPDGQIFHTFVPVANLGVSSDGNPYHQISHELGMDTVFAMQDDSTITLSELLSSHEGETLYISSILSNLATDGIFEVAATDNLGTDGVLYSGTAGFEINAGFAHLLLPVSAPVLGDVNLDQSVNFLDISPFIALLSGGTFQDEADINQDGQVTFLDISPFIAILSGQ